LKQLVGKLGLRAHGIEGVDADLTEQPTADALELERQGRAARPMPEHTLGARQIQRHTEA
jgi:hypothetical protein